MRNIKPHEITTAFDFKYALASAYASKLPRQNILIYKKYCNLCGNPIQTTNKERKP